MEFNLSIMLFVYMYFTGSLKKNALTNQINRKEAEKAVSNWLIGDRGGNRTARAHGGEQDAKKK